MASPEFGGSLGRSRVKGRHADTHRSDCLASITDAAHACEGHHRFAVGSRRSDEFGLGLVSGFDVVDGALMVIVCVVEQPDEDARVKDQ